MGYKILAGVEWDLCRYASFCDAANRINPQNYGKHRIKILQPRVDSCEKPLSLRGEVAMNQMNAFYYEDQFLDDAEIDDLDDFHICPRCNTEFETMEELEYIEEHRVCPSCLSDLTMQAAEDSMDF